MAPGSALRRWRRWWRGSRDPAARDEIESRPEPDPHPDRLIVGLGNPGPRYADTRHNVGFRVVERLASRHACVWRDVPGLGADLAHFRLPIGQADEADRRAIVCLLLRPRTYVNASGRAVEAALERWPGLDPAHDLLVVYDDLSLPTGRLRLRASGGAGGHNGMADILSRLDRRDLPRLRFGIGHPGDASGVLDWVLGPFAESENGRVEAALDRAAQAVESVLTDGLEASMGRFNAAEADA